MSTGVLVVDREEEIMKCAAEVDILLYKLYPNSFNSMMSHLHDTLYPSIQLMSACGPLNLNLRDIGFVTVPHGALWSANSRNAVLFRSLYRNLHKAVRIRSEN